MYCRWLDQLLTLFRLNIINVVRVLVHRLKIKTKYYQLCMPVSDWHLPMQYCFAPSAKSTTVLMSLPTYENFIVMVGRILEGNWCFYFYHWFYGGVFPSWIWCPFIGREWAAVRSHWSALHFFSKPGEDIKNIWELSRFYWAPQLALAYRFTGEQHYQERLNKLIQHWCAFNRPQEGYQWLCAQETAIRLSNFLLADYLLHTNRDPRSLVTVEFIEVHVKRILSTMSYAVAQDNNHAISEAAALYFAGAWLSSYAQSSALAEKALSKGKFWLENRVQSLIAKDGTFAQYSVTYHRLVLDILSLCVWIQKKNRLSSFSDMFWQRYRYAFVWLFDLVDPFSGDAPNLGANDGAMFFKLDSCDYRDFRPTLQLASVLLNQKKLYCSGLWDAPLVALGIEHEKLPVQMKSTKSKEFCDGGFVKFNSINYWLLLRYSRFHFRPSHADIFHVDLWVDGQNILQDSGSYSYNLNYLSDAEFKGIAAHNTIQLDGHEQMPLLSRFLWGAWPTTRVLSFLKNLGKEIAWRGEYRDYLSGRHRREARQTVNGYCITDWVSGYQKQAVLRWHVCSGNWVLETDGLRLGKVKLLICVNGLVVLPVRKESWCSLYHQQKNIRPVFEIVLIPPESTVETFIELDR